MALASFLVEVLSANLSLSLIFVVFILASSIYAFAISQQRSSGRAKHLKSPPSPSGARLLSGHAHLYDGTLLSNPTQSPLVKWSHELGEIYSIRMGPRDRWYVLSSREAIKHVFDKHGSVTGNKPRLIAANELLSGGNRIIFMSYGKKWRQLRGILHQCLSVSAVEVQKPSQDIESKIYLNNILSDPSNFQEHLKRFSLGVIIYATYGIRIFSLDSRLLRSIYEVTDMFAAVFGSRYLVDLYPILDKLPEPLQWWRASIQPWRERGDQNMLALWNRLRKKLDSGVRSGCFVEKFMETDYPKLGITDIEAAWVAGSMIEAGADTTHVTLNSLVLGLVAFPEVVQKAHAELDRVVGDRMPEFEDAPSLPYIRAMIKEVLRWRSPANDSPRHETTEDVEYKGYLIPAGSSIILNHWALHSDPALYLEPERFNPDRFMGTKIENMSIGECINASDPKNRDNYSFGAGRRVCPGYNLAENSVFIVAARLLWAFDVQAPVDPKTGQIQPVDTWNYHPSLLFSPRLHPAEFRVRDDQRAQLIRDSVKDVELLFSGEEEEVI